MVNEDHSLKNKTYKGFFWIGLSTFSNTVMRLITIVVLSRFLDPREFGIVAAVQIIISFAEIFSTAGVGPALIQKNKITKKDVSTGFFLNIILGIILFMILYLLSEPISKFVGIDNPIYLKVLSIIIIINSISIVSESLIQREMKFKSIANINIITFTIYSIVAVVLAVLNFGVWSVILAQVAQTFVRSLLFVMKKPIFNKVELSFESAKSISYFGFGFTLSRIFNNFANQADYFVVGKFLGTSALGYYSRSYQLLMLPTNILGTIMDKVTFPLMSQLQNNKLKLGNVYTNFMLLYGILTLPIITVSILSAEELIYIFLGPNWSAVIIPFQVLIGGLFFRVGYKISDTAVRALGAVYKRLWIQVVYALAVFFGAIIGSKWGITGVAIATTFSIMLNYILMNYLIWKMIKFDLKYLYSNLISVFIGVILTLLPLIYFLPEIIDLGIESFLLSNLVSLFIKSIIIFCYITIMYYLFYRFNRNNEFIKFISNQKIFNKLKRVS